MSGFERQRQGAEARRHTGARLGLAMALLLLGAGLSACGKKPGHVDPPVEVTEDKFPLVYPDPKTDPKP